MFAVSSTNALPVLQPHRRRQQLNRPAPQRRRQRRFAPRPRPAPREKSPVVRSSTTVESLGNAIRAERAGNATRPINANRLLSSRFVESVVCATELVPACRLREGSAFPVRLINAPFWRRATAVAAVWEGFLSFAHLILRTDAARPPAIRKSVASEILRGSTEQGAVLVNLAIPASAWMAAVYRILSNALIARSAISPMACASIIRS